MDPAFIARTHHHQLLLDESGVCFQVFRIRDGGGMAAEGASRCLGAQFVAALDPNEPGFLRPEPTVGVPMLFAKANAQGKICVVRTGALEQFESCSVPDRPTQPSVPPPEAGGLPIPYLNLGRVSREAPDTVTDLQAAAGRTRARPDRTEDDEPTGRFRGVRELSMTHQTARGLTVVSVLPRPSLVLVKRSR